MMFLPALRAACAERASGRPPFLSAGKRSPIRKRGGSDHLAEMLAHRCRGPEPRFCGEPLHCQLGCFEQGLRTADARAGDPIGRSRTNLCAEVTAQRSRAHGRSLDDASSLKTRFGGPEAVRRSGVDPHSLVELLQYLRPASPLFPLRHSGRRRRYKRGFATRPRPSRAGTRSRIR